MPKRKASTRWIAVFSASFLALGQAVAEPFIVKDGQARADIVIAAHPPRTVRLAAQDLQTYLEKISGARLSIVTAPSADLPVHVYVGTSPHTTALKVTDEGLPDGAYRMVSGTNWLALLGQDTEFTPIEPISRSRSDLTSGRVQAEWDKLTGGAQWGYPFSGIYKQSMNMPPTPGIATSLVARSAGEKLWGFDERGSFNAVCGFLYRLGVRWYMPGELGEVVPTLATVELPAIDKTVRPAVPVRRFNFRFGTQPLDTSLWAMRLGARDPYGLLVAHGIATFAERPDFIAAHPEYYALYGGKRNIQPDASHHHTCLSSAGLFDENVRFARTLFDHYKIDVVSVMPADAFIAICQCPLCAGKDTPERGTRGHLSDYVWDYVNRVAAETARTHPDRKILCCAYGSYTLPPVKIEKLHPNVVVAVVGGRRPTANKPEQMAEAKALRDAWRAKTDNKILFFENYPFTGRGYCMPSYVPHAMGTSINDTKAYSMGEDIWLTLGTRLDAPGYNHFNVYFTARMYWEDDVKALFDEYCRLFYGPAEQEMKAFFEFCEANWQDMQKNTAPIARAFELFAAAEGKADAGSVYGRRIATIAEYLTGLRKLSEELAKPRGPAPEQRAADNATEIRIDGRLDEAFWRNLPADAGGELKVLQTTNTPVHPTRFQVAWGGNSLYVAVRCDDTDGTPLNITATRNDDQALWYGDAVEIQLESDLHAYYQVAINPAGAVADVDRAAGKQGFPWSSQAEVAVTTNAGGWTLEARFPVTADENDPLNQVIGHKPTPEKPWYFNVCRQRIREKNTEASAFSALTKTRTFHDVRTFAKLYVK